MAAGRDVEFGCVVAAAAAPGSSDRELYQGMLGDCELYSELNFGTIWVLEHHFSDYFPTPDPAVQIAHLAGRFPELGFGTCVIVTPWHNPLRLAGQIAMLTQLTDQPLHLGLGRGTAKFEYDAYGLDMGEARARFQETWEIVRLAMTGGPFTYASGPSPGQRTCISTARSAAPTAPESWPDSACRQSATPSVTWTARRPPCAAGLMRRPRPGWTWPGQRSRS